MTEVSGETVDELDGFFRENADEITRLVNFSRDRLGDVFGEDVESVERDEIVDEFEEIMRDDDLALNLAALYKLGVELEVGNDYAGFVVDEVIGRKIAATVAGNDPERTLAEATFHYVDVHTHEVIDEGRGAGYDDVVAGLAAGLQCRLPGWDWQEEGL